jgi:uncharacterized protein YbjT (DUF2867 family)
MPEGGQKTIVMAGATGFVGSRLRHALREDYKLICLTRSSARLEERRSHPNEEWRACDLFSLLELEKSLQGADYAIYLVHSMMPSARLLQGSFADLDLIMADNFARAARHCRLRQIIYLGGLIPPMASLSPHLASRLEVEEALGSGSVPVTALRAGLIVGRGGSSLRIVVNLVKRLPVMLLPEWTRTQTQPVAIEDVIRAFRETLGQPERYTGHFDIGGPDRMSYREMLSRTARALGRRRLFINVPFFSARLSKLWVSMLGGASRYLVGPLVDSLRHPMVASPNRLQDRLAPDAVPFDTAMEKAVGAEGRSAPNPRDSLRRRDRQSIRKARRVRSVQRMVLPEDETADSIMRAYFKWLPSLLGPFLKGSVEADTIWRLSLIRPGWVLIEFTRSRQRSSPERQLLYITGGLLARVRHNRKGRIEFRELLNRRYLMVAIHDYTPTLPWYLYSRTQAVFHLWVMRRFSDRLGRIKAR